MEAKGPSVMDFRVFLDVGRVETMLMGSEEFKAESRVSREQWQAKLGISCSKDDVLIIGERKATKRQNGYLSLTSR